MRFPSISTYILNHLPPNPYVISTKIVSLILKWLPGLGSNLGAVFITNDLTEVIGCFNADSLTNSMHSSGVHIGLE